MTEANNDTYCKTDDGSRMTPKRLFIDENIIIIIINMKLLLFIFTNKLHIV